MYYNVPVTISKQEDGLWRATVPGIPGCWVDCPTLEQALAEIHEVFALFADLYQEEGRALPEAVTVSTALPLEARVPVAFSEHKIRRVGKRGVKASGAAGKQPVSL